MGHQMPLLVTAKLVKRQTKALPKVPTVGFVCGVVRCGVVWCGMWCGAVWCDVSKVLLPKGNGRDCLARGKIQAGRAGRLSERCV